MIALGISFIIIAVLLPIILPIMLWILWDKSLNLNTLRQIYSLFFKG